MKRVPIYLYCLILLTLPYLRTFETLTQPVALIVDPRTGSPIPVLPGGYFNVTVYSRQNFSRIEVYIYAAIPYNSVILTKNFSLKVYKSLRIERGYIITLKVPENVPPFLYSLKIVFFLDKNYFSSEEENCIWVLKSPPSSLKILHISDTHIGYSVESSYKTFTAFLLAKLLGADLIIASGDITDTASESQYLEMKELILEFASEIPIFAFPGNHDKSSESDFYSQFLGLRNYYRKVGNFLIVGVDTGELGSIDIETVRWINQTFSSNNVPVKILVMHHPIFSTNVYGDLNLSISDINESYFYSSWRSNIQVTRSLLNVILYNNVTLVLSGHVHTDRIVKYTSPEKKNVVWFVTTTTTGAGRPEYNGIRLIQVYENGSVSFPCMTSEFSYRSFPNSIPVEDKQLGTSLFKFIFSNSKDSLTLNLSNKLEGMNLSGEILVRVDKKAEINSYKLYYRSYGCSNVSLISKATLSNWNYFLLKIDLPYLSSLQFTISTYEDDIAPDISLAYMIPSKAQENSPLTIFFAVRDKGWGISYVVAKVIEEGKPSSRIFICNKEGELYTLRLPGYPGNTTLLISATAFDAAGLSNSTYIVVFIPPRVIPKAMFVLSNLTISPEEVEAKENVKISINVKNSGNLAGEIQLNLKVNGTLEETKKVSLKPGESTTVLFYVTKEVPGVYIVDVNSKTGSFTVKEKSILKLEYGLLILLFIALSLFILYVLSKRGLSRS